MIITLLWAFLLSLSPSESFSSPKNYARGAVPISLSMARDESSIQAQKVDLCIIGGGISGLSAAITAAEKSIQQSSKDLSQPSPSILLLESDSAVGGRVRSDFTDDGFILDRGFAVFIEEYPQSKKMLDYDALGLKQFLPGARVKLLGREKLACVSDPLRRRRDIFRAIASPVGTPLDKLRLLPLFYLVMTKSIDELFAMEETDTLTCLKNKYNFSEEFISSFFAPFLEGVYLTPLEKQSSRMFHFVMKMNTVGSSSLPKGGMQAVSNQIEEKANKLGVDIQFESRALSIKPASSEESSGEFLVEIGSKERGKQTVHARTVIIATEFNVAHNLLQDMDGFEPSMKPLPKLPQRSVGSIYYGFQSPAPLADPILILNGEGDKHRNTKDLPINNVCFPSIVQKGYAPDGYDLCSVSVCEKALSEHAGDHISLDGSVRRQLSTWFPDYADDIMDESKWVQKGVYVINNAQPAHYGNDGCANVHGGRDCSTFQGVVMPNGVFVCGDHMATSTFNGALESGTNAGDAVARFLAES
mmetsp:Transcript_539/g.1068  ORF Transcript_539/g.1068 Transcript_539/m.1068 type:complete len:530 (-) Transcript_539:103-1692(-)